jgi:hypothetical protein
VNSDGTGAAVAYDAYPVGGGVVVDPATEWFYFATQSGTIYRARIDGTLAEPVASNLGGSLTYWSLSPFGDKIAYTEIVGGKNVISVVNADGTGHRQLTTPFAAPDPAGCYSPVWSTDQSSVLMHCYPGPGGAIGIYRVSAAAIAASVPTPIGGSFRSRNPDHAGSRPTN